MLEVVSGPWGACRCHSCHFPQRMEQKVKAASFQHCHGGTEIQCNHMIQRNHSHPVAHTHQSRRMMAAQGWPGLQEAHTW